MYHQPNSRAVRSFDRHIDNATAMGMVSSRKPQRNAKFSQLLDSTFTMRSTAAASAATHPTHIAGNNRRKRYVLGDRRNGEGITANFVSGDAEPQILRSTPPKTPEPPGTSGRVCAMFTDDLGNIASFVNGHINNSHSPPVPDSFTHEPPPARAVSRGPLPHPGGPSAPTGRAPSPRLYGGTSVTMGSSLLSHGLTSSRRPATAPAPGMGSLRGDSSGRSQNEQRLGQQPFHPQRRHGEPNSPCVLRALIQGGARTKERTESHTSRALERQKIKRAEERAARHYEDIAYGRVIPKLNAGDAVDDIFKKRIHKTKSIGPLVI